MTPALETFSILSPEFHDNPYEFFSFLRDTSPVYYEAALDSYFISRHADVAHVLKNPEIFTTRSLAVRAEPVMRGPVLAQMHGDEHLAKRKIVARAFTGQVLRDHQAPLIRENAEQLLAPFLAEGQIDLVNDFGKTFAVCVTLDVLGLPKADHEQIALWHHGIADFITSVNQAPDARVHSLACSQALADYLTPIIEERRAAPELDLISTLCHAEFGGVTMTTTNILALILNVLLAATEPADKTLALLMYHLINNPQQMQDVLADPPLLRNAIVETLRFTPPVQLIPRQLAERAPVGPEVLGEGTTVFCLIGAANRDPAVFERPGIFDIHRADLGLAGAFGGAASHLAFGKGMHTCIGAAFARTEIEIVAEVVLNRLRNVKLQSGWDYKEAGLYTRGPVALPLSFDPVGQYGGRGCRQGGPARRGAASV